MKVVTLMLLLSATAPRLEGADAAVWQRVADGAKWQWHPEMAGPIYCVFHSQDEFTYVIERKPAERGLVFSIRRGDKELYKWSGHHRSVFCVRSGILYYAIFETKVSGGGTIAAVNLESGAELWRERLAGGGERAFSASSCLMTLAANDEVVTIVGNETAGKYIEFKDIKTGKTVGYHRFSKEEVQAGISEQAG